MKNTPNRITTNWTPEEMEYLYTARVQKLPYRIIAETLGRTEKSCECKYRETNWETLGIAEPPVDPDSVLGHPVEENEFIKVSQFTGKQINYLSRRLDVFRMRTDAIVDAVVKACNKLPKSLPTPYTPPKCKKDRSPEDIGLLLSDLHIGEEFSKEETGGISEYNMDVFKKRLMNLRDAVVEIYELHAAERLIEDLHIFCAGDLVAGMNNVGAWSPVYIASPITDQAIGGANLLKQVIHYWCPMFKHIYFHGVVGNHGRAAPVGQQKDYDNWDYISYKFLEASFSENNRVTFNIPKSWWLMETIKNHKFMMVHGDHTKGATPIKRLEAFEQKMGSILRQNADYILAGHFHNCAELTTNSGRIMINGSFVGSDVYSLKTVHATSRPEQKMFGIHDKHGVSWTYNINLDSSRVK